MQKDHTAAQKRLARVRRIWKNNPKTFATAVLEYFQKPSRDIIKLRRARAIERFCHRRAVKTNKRYWKLRKRAWHERVERLEKRIAAEAIDRFQIIPRKRWNAASPRTAPVPQTKYGKGWFFHHTVAGNPSTRAGEEAEMRNLQSIAFSRGFADISYPYVVFDSGRVYEGRREGTVGAHTLGYNSTATALAWAGNKVKQVPTEASLNSARKLVNLRGAQVPKKARPHYAVYPTACPGQRLGAFAETI